jgi:hypothetical protein
MMGLPVMLDDLRIALREVDALATLTAAACDEADWTDPDPGVVEGIGSLLGLIKKSSAQAMVAFHRLHDAVADAAAAPKGEQTDAASGDGMSAEDAAIIRRIRAQCPDKRFDGGSDVELLHLFKHNRQVLHRSDEDVIAVMTRPR